MYNLEIEGRRIVFNCPFNLKDEIKALGAKWNKPIEKKWSVGSKTISTDLVRFVDRHKLTIDPRLEDRFSAIRRTLEAEDLNHEYYREVVASQVEKFLNKQTLSGKTLMSHQKEFLQEFINNNFNIINALFPGSGKSIASAYAAAMLGVKIILIVLPSTIDNWKRELADCEIDAEIYSFAKIPENVEGAFVLLCDESHIYQSVTSQRTKRMLNLSLAPNCISVIHLTGTPMRNGRPSNIFPLLKSIKHPIAKNQTHYEIFYCEAGPTRFQKWDTSGAANLEDLHLKTKDSIFVRERKKCLDLPEFTRVFKEVELEPKVQKWYYSQLKKLKADYYKRAEAGEIKSVKGHDGKLIPLGTTVAFLSYARRLSSFVKIPYTIDMIKELTKDGSQVLVFTWFKEVAEGLAERIGCKTITGDTPQKQRQPIIDEFQEGKINVLCNTFGAGGVGLNIQAADYLILMDRDHVPAYYEQAEARAYRAGRKLPVTSIWLNASWHEVDKIIDKIILEKQERIDLVLKGKVHTLRGLMNFESIAPELLGNMFDFE